MILTAHLLTGAALASKIHCAPLALSLAFLSHYFLDLIPHQEYSIENIREKRWKKSQLDFLKVFLDISFGTFFILLLAKNNPLIFTAAFLAILPDGFTLLSLVFPNKMLRIHDNFHQKIHFLEYKKIPVFWRIFSQVLVVSLAIFFLR